MRIKKDCKNWEGNECKIYGAIIRCIFCDYYEKSSHSNY
jgi:hypothetical protein